MKNNSIDYQAKHIFPFLSPQNGPYTVVFLDFSMHQHPLESLLKHRLQGSTPSFRFSRTGVELNNLHFLQVPSSFDTANLEIKLRTTAL